jgi:DNA-binding CsgD family transcriptional regulator
MAAGVNVTQAKRQRQVEILLLQEKTYEEIAASTGLKVGTVKDWVSRIYRKNGVHSRAQFFKKVMEGPSVGEKGP